MVLLVVPVGKLVVGAVVGSAGKTSAEAVCDDSRWR